MQDYADIFASWNSIPEAVCDDDPYEVYILKMKENGKELDPAAFDAKERKGDCQGG